MKIRMLKQTFWEGRPLRVGDTPDVDSYVAMRWLARGIAEEIVDVPEAPVAAEETEKTAEAEPESEKKKEAPPVKKSSASVNKKQLGAVIKKHDARVTGEAD